MASLAAARRWLLGTAPELLGLYLAVAGVVAASTMGLTAKLAGKCRWPARQGVLGQGAGATYFAAATP